MGVSCRYLAPSLEEQLQQLAPFGIFMQLPVVSGVETSRPGQLHQKRAACHGCLCRTGSGCLMPHPMLPHVKFSVLGNVLWWEHEVAEHGGQPVFKKTDEARARFCNLSITLPLIAVAFAPLKAKPSFLYFDTQKDLDERNTGQSGSNCKQTAVFLEERWRIAKSMEEKGCPGFGFADDPRDGYDDVRVATAVNSDRGMHRTNFEKAFL